MPNLAKLYTGITKNPIVDKKPTEDINVDIARQQLVSNWKASTITKELHNTLTDEICKLFDECVSLANTYPSHQNPHKIVQNLTKIKTLKDIIESYV